MCCSLTAESLKQKIREKEGLQFYLMPERVEAFVPAISTTNDRRFLLDNSDKYLNQVKILTKSPFDQIGLAVGFPKTFEVEAGRGLRSLVSIEVPRSII